MNERLIINKKNKSALVVVQDQMVESYQNGFAEAPWNERSKCLSNACGSFSSDFPGSVCTECGDELGDAYNAQELVQGWLNVLDEDGTIFVTLESDIPVCTTIVRPTDVNELYERKYSDVPQMQTWLQELINGKFVWIEDTYANTAVKKKGNLRDRKEVLTAIASRYSGLLIATRTIVPAVISATARDVGQYTDVFEGISDVKTPRRDLFRKIGKVPDYRTLLSIDGSQLS